MSIPVNAKKRGRPPGQEFPVSVQLRLTEAQAAALDAWRAAQPDEPSRSEAIRFAVTDWLIGLGHLPHREDPEMAN